MRIFVRLFLFKKRKKRNFFKKTMFNTVLIGDVYHVQDESGRTIHSFSRALQPPISTPVGVVAPPSVSAVPALPAAYCGHYCGS